LVSRNAERLMLGYLLGAYVISITLVLVIVFALPTHSSTVTTSRNTLSPAMDLALGLIAILVGIVLMTARDRMRVAEPAQGKEGRQGTAAMATRSR
jgi:uncharacterized membrane protein